MSDIDRVCRGKRIMLVTGRSGGHILPAVSVLERICLEGEVNQALLVVPSCAVVPLSVRKSSRWKTAALPYPTDATRNLLGRISVPLYLPAIFLKSFYLLLVFRPHTVAGFGSLCSVPMLLLAKLFGIRTLIHEQNVIPGKANRLLSVVADRVAISFSGTVEYLGGCRGKAVLTGNPLRRGLRRLDKKEALDFFGLRPERFTVLVTGGSQGSRRINEMFVRAVNLSAKNAPLQVIHLTGKMCFERIKKEYSGCPVEVKVYDFLPSMEYAYSAADLVISRAGAITVSEIAFFSLPALLIPYPFAHEHQFANAQVLVQAGAAIAVRDCDLTPEYLARQLASFSAAPSVLSDMRLGYSSVGLLDAGRLVAEEIISLTCRA